MPNLTVDVPGEAKPQGSKTGYVVNGRVRMVEASKGLKTRRSEVAQVIHSEAYNQKWVRVEGNQPVNVAVIFEFIKPKSALKRVHHTVRPDLDKLVRFTLDAITEAGNVWADDSQVNVLSARKQYGIKARTLIVIEGDNDESVRGD